MPSDTFEKSRVWVKDDQELQRCRKVGLAGGACCLCWHGSPGGGESAGVDGQSGAKKNDGLSSLVDSEAIEPGEVCEWGGVRVLSGLDADANGELAAAEV